MRKGIILAGGSGTRLMPLTKVISKQLLPVFDKPMIFYLILTLISAGIKRIAIITNPSDKVMFEKLLSDGSDWGVSFEYLIQESPDGLAQAFIIAENFLAGDSSALILGDNIFLGTVSDKLQKLSRDCVQGASIFIKEVQQPERFGVAVLNAQSEVVELEEKPSAPKTNFAVTGLYFCDGNAPARAKNLKPSKRNELEIIDLLDSYRLDGLLKAELFGQTVAWFDAGTHDSLLDVGNFVRSFQSVNR